MELKDKRIMIKFFHRTLIAVFLLVLCFVAPFFGTKFYILWISGGLAFAAAYVGLMLASRKEFLRRKLKPIIPQDWNPEVEIYGIDFKQYIGISMKNGKIVIANITRKILRCENLSFLKEWEILEYDKHISLTFKFNDFVYSSLTIDISHLNRLDVEAKLHHAWNFLEQGYQLKSV
jgi:hypothetical protein